MRKLNAKNKTYITALSLFAIIVLAIIAIFAFSKIKELNIRYMVSINSVAFNKDKELINVSENTYAKKDMLGRYYLLLNDKKVFLGENSVIFNKESSNLTLLGTFYEIHANGEVEKIKGMNTINTQNKNRIFKISDRKYLVVGPNLKSRDGSLNTTDYLLIDIDKVGNCLLYNNELNIKTFSDLYIENIDFTLKANEELLTILEEEIDLAKINGSTNEYSTRKKVEEEEENNGGGGNGAGEGIGNGGGGNNNPTKPEDVVKEEKYVARKTSILGTTTTTEEINLSYVVYDPFTEYKNLYVVLYDSKGNKLDTYTLDMEATTFTISGVKASEKYVLDFYYTFEDEVGNSIDILFDTMSVHTKDVKAKISLEMVSENSVRYILKVDDGYLLDSAKIKLYVTKEGSETKVYTQNLTADMLSMAASANGYQGIFTDVNLDGEFGIIELSDSIYHASKISIDASYKFKI